MQTWLHAVCKTGVFIICSQVLIHCRPDSSYEKYLKMLVSVMILLQLLLPVHRILTGEGGNDPEERIQWFQEQLSNDGRLQQNDGIYREGMETEQTEDIDGTGQEQEIERVWIAPVRWEADSYAEE